MCDAQGKQLPVSISLSEFVVGNLLSYQVSEVTSCLIRTWRLLQDYLENCPMTYGAITSAQAIEGTNALEPLISTTLFDFFS